MLETYREHIMYRMQRKLIYETINVLLDFIVREQVR